MDIKQIIYALERQIAALEAHADKLHEDGDYSAEFPAEDAERLREAIKILRDNASSPDRASVVEECARLCTGDKVGWGEIYAARIRALAPAPKT